MKIITRMDFAIIDARIRRRMELERLPTVSAGFLRLVVDQLFPSALNSAPEIITDGSDDRGVDALHIVEGPAAVEVFLVQSKYRENLESCNRTINDQEVLKVSLFLTELFDQAESLRRCNNLRIQEGVRRIWDIHARGKICRYRVLFCSNGGGLSASAQGIADSFASSNTNVTFEFFGADEILLGLHQEGAERESGKLRVVGKEIFERSDGDIRGVIASVDARSFVELIADPSGGSVKRHLFDDNLRVFLGSKGGYNPAIIETATSQDSHLFWYLNNGITITCRNFTYNKGHVSPWLNLDSFQIVNGAQTSHSLFEAFRSGSQFLENTVLMVRAYATERPDIAERVAVATNSQARIQARDLRANADVLKRLELAFAEHGYYFERKRNMHSDQREDRRIDALKLGQILLSHDLREPDKARSDSDSIFESRFDSIFHNSLDVGRLIDLFELYRVIEDLRDKYNAEYGDNVESGQSHQYLVYGHWFILYACALLSLRKTEGRTPRGAAAVERVDEAISLVAAACGQQKAVAHYQLFRSSRTRDKIIAELGGKQLDFLDLLAAES